MNEFVLSLIAKLNKQLSKNSINNDLKSLNNTMFVRVVAKLSKTLTRKALNQQLKALNNLEVQVGTKVRVDKNAKTQIKNNIKNLQKELSDLEIGLKASKASNKINSDIDSIKQAAQKKAKNNPINIDLNIKKEKLISDITYLGKRYSKLFSNVSMSKKYENILNSAYSVSDDKQLKSIRAELQAFNSEIRACGLAAKSTGDKWKGLIGHFKDLASVATIARLIIAETKKAVTTTIELDKVFTDLVKVQSDITRNDYSDYLDLCTKKAKELATTQKGLIEGVTEFSRSGYDLDTSNKLTEKSTILSNVGDMSADDSAKAIISGVQAYDAVDGYTDVTAKAQALIDKYNELGNTASITTAELAQGVQSVGSVFADANTSVDQFLALLSAGNRQYQNADTLALGLRTSALRIRGCTTELEAMGEETDTVVTSTATLEKRIKGLTNIDGSGGVEILEADKETFRSIYDIYLDISKVYKEMSDTDQAALLELIAGKHRASAISATLNNMTEAEEILQNSLNAAGSAQREYDAYLESTEAHLQKFQSRLVETYSNFLNGGMVSGAVDIGSAILDLVNSADLLKHSLLAVLALNFGKGISAIGAGVASTVQQMNTLGSALQQMKNLPIESGSRNNVIMQLGESTKSLTEKNLKLLLSQKQLNNTDRENILLQHNLTQEEALAKLEKMGLTTATNEQTAATTAEAASTFTLSGAMNTLKMSAIGMWESFKAAFAANPIGMTLTIVTTAISIISILNNTVEEQAQALEDAKDKFSQTSNEVKSLNDELKTTQEKIEELQKLADAGTISVADENELKTLKETNDELERKIALKQKEQIDDAKDLLNKVQKSAGKKELYSYAHYNNEGKYVTVTKHDTAVNRLQNNIEGYQDALKYYGKDKINTDNYDNAISEDAEIVGNLVEAYQSLKNAGIDLTKQQQAEYEGALKAQNAYLLFSYNLNKTKEGFRALNEEQQRTILYNRLLEQGLAEQEAKAVMKHISKEELEDYYDLDFTFPLPAAKDYKTADEYGKAYAQAWKRGVDSVAKESNNNDDISTPKTFKEVWDSLGKTGDDDAKKAAQEAKEELLELAEAGQLTWKTLEKSSISSVFKDAGVSIEEATRKINAFIENSKQLDSMRTGMTAITSVYDEKKNAKDNRVGANTLNSLYSTLNVDNWDEDGLEVWEKYKKAASDAKKPLKEFKDLQDQLATSFVNSNNFLANLNKENQEYYDNELKEMGVTNAHAVTTEIINRKTDALASMKDIAKKKGKELSDVTLDEITSSKEYKAATDSARKGLLDLYLQQNILSNSKLNMTQKISALKDFITEIDKAHSKMILLKAETRFDNTMKKELNKTNGTRMGQAAKKARRAKKNYLAKAAKDLIKTQNDLSTTNGNKADNTKKTKDKDSSKSKKSTQVIDWIARRLDVLQSKIDLTKAKFENLFSLNSKKNNLNTQIKQTTKLLNAQQKAAAKYQKKANSVKLSKSLKNKVKNGKVSGSLSSLIATYGESTANKITKYQDYTDKAKQSTKAVQELKKNILDLKKQKYQLYVDNADAKTSAINAQQENAITASSKNSYERNKLSWIKQSYNYQIKIAQLEKDSVKVAQLRAEKEKAIADSYKQQFDNIKNEYDNKIGLNESNIATTQAEISALEAQGRRLSTSYYSNMIGITGKDKALLIEEKARLEESLKNIKAGSDEWYEAKQSIHSVAQEIYKCDQNMAEFQKTINELDLKRFELIASQLESAASHTQFLIDLLSHKDLTSKDVGGITKEGMAALSLYFDKMKNNQEAINNIHNEWAKFTEQVGRGDSGLSEEEIQAKYESYSQEIRELIKNNEDLKDSIKSLVEEAFNMQLDALNDLIQKRREALQSEKDLYDFQRKIADQTKKVTAIQKQMAALTGDDSEETRARLQQLKISLDEAEQDLKDTEYDKWISDQEDMLDDLSEDFEDFITNALKDTDALIESVENAVAENSVMIADVIREQGYGDADTVGTKYNKDGSYETTVTNYDGGLTKFAYDAKGNLQNIISTDSEGNIVYDKSKADAQKAAEEKKSAAEANAQKIQSAGDAKSQRQTENNNLLEKIVKLFAKSRAPKSSNEYAASNLTKYGSQMFASTYGGTKLLASSDAKNIDAYVKQLKNPDTGKALYNTSTADYILKALNSINNKNKKVLSNAVKNGITPSGISGFANGGVIAGTSYYGDKLIAKVNSGESVLTKEFTDMLPHTVDMMSDFVKLNIPDPTKYLQKSAMQNNVNVGDVNIHLDGSNIFDEKSFMDSFTHSTQMQNAVKTAVANDFAKPYSNTFGRI